MARKKLQNSFASLAPDSSSDDESTPLAKPPTVAKPPPVAKLAAIKPTPEPAKLVVEKLPVVTKPPPSKLPQEDEDNDDGWETQLSKPKPARRNLATLASAPGAAAGGGAAISASTSTSTSTPTLSFLMTQENEHLLNYPWALYYHSPKVDSWTQASYNQVSYFLTLEDYVKFYLYFPFTIYQNGGYYVMIRGNWHVAADGTRTYSFQPPLWEHFNVGGAWSFKVPFQQLDECWFLTGLAIICNTLCDADSRGGRIEAMSISPKKKQATVRVWSNLTTFLFNSRNLETVLSHRILGLPATTADVLVVKHSEPKAQYDMDGNRRDDPDSDETHVKGPAGRRQAQFGRKW